MRRATRTTKPAGGFTLIELLLALAISAIVMTAVPVMISLSAKAAPGNSGIQSAGSEAAGFFAKLNADLQLAQAVTALTSESITMTTPARSGTGTMQVTYAWGGTAGDPVTVENDGGTPETLVTAAESLVFGAVAGSKTVYTEHTLTEQTGRGIQSATSGATGLAIPPSGALLQIIKPPADADIFAWSIEGVEIALACGSPITGESVLVEIKQLVSGEPVGHTYHTTEIPSRDLSASWQIHTVPIPAFPLDTAESVGLVLSVTSSSLSVQTVSADASGFDGGALRAQTSDGGIWATSSTRVLYHRVLGGTMSQTGGATSRGTIARLDVTLTTGDGSWKYATSISPLSPVTKP